jgi:hypothetical protein
MPANFPPVECDAETLSGLGTPDLMGALGVSFYFSDVEPPNLEEIRDTEITIVDISSHKCEPFLLGPSNPFHKSGETARVPFTVHRDPVNPVVRITIQGQEILLKEKEWSDWVRVRFDLLPRVSSATGICRFLVQEVHPHFRLYVTPINLDPTSPALPIATPADYASRLARELGLFHTLGIAENTKALSSGILAEEEYLQQAMSVFEEDLQAYDYLLGRYQAGLLFFYFSTIDLNSHMFWRAMDPRHPLYSRELDRQYGKTIEDLYAKMDEVLGRTLNHIDDDTTLIILSDHGFNPFHRTFGVNSWLLENGYARLIDPVERGRHRLFANTDWSKTVAYGLGINSLYLNIRGREGDGIVSRGRQADALLNRLVKDLEAVKDPETGERVIARAYTKNEVYRGKNAEQAPDIILGFNRGYRASWDTILGSYELDIVGDNTDKWSGDHCMDVAGLQGVLLTNKPLLSDDPALIDLAPTILAEYGIEAPPGTEGNALWRG